MKYARMNQRLALVSAGLLVIGLVLVGCDQQAKLEMAGHGDHYNQVNLVADNASFNPKTVDPTLLNAWGLDMDPQGNFGMGANHSGLGLFYDNKGKATLPAVQIPGAGAPSGLVYNSSDEFKMPGGKGKGKDKVKFIFSTEDGLICAWASGPSAMIVAGPLDAGAEYKGLALAKQGDKTYLYATNFGDGEIDVFDGSFKLVTHFTFTDPNLPPEYSPFGIANVDEKLFITYAIPNGSGDDEAGPGHGIVDVFNPDGHFVRRFYSNDVLNSPWGVTQAPDGFGGPGPKKAILIGNFGDGRINAFDNSGKFMGPLTMPDGTPIWIDGLWALGVMPGPGMNDKVFFTAGPNHEADGLFGFLQAQ